MLLSLHLGDQTQVHISNGSDRIVYNNLSFWPNGGFELLKLTFNETGIEEFRIKGVFNEYLPAKLFKSNAILGAYCAIYDQDSQIAMGYILKAHFDELSYNLEIAGVESYVNAGLRQYFSINCRADFCSKRCGLDISNFTYSCSIIHTEGQKVLIKRYNALDFTNGTLIYQGSRYRILVDDGIYITLLVVLNANQSKEASIALGCSKTIEACRQYNNAINFQGEPFMLKKLTI